MDSLRLGATSSAPLTFASNTESPSSLGTMATVMCVEASDDADADVDVDVDVDVETDAAAEGGHGGQRQDSPWHASCRCDLSGHSVLPLGVTEPLFGLLQGAFDRAADHPGPASVAVSQKVRLTRTRG